MPEKGARCKIMVPSNDIRDKSDTLENERKR
jgi:hypothetical protein